MKKFNLKNLWVLDNLFNLKKFQTKKRNTIILPGYVGKTLYVHNGKTFDKILIVKEMVGYKLGEFSKTRKTFKFKKK